MAILREWRGGPLGDWRTAVDDFVLMVARGSVPIETRVLCLCILRDDRRYAETMLDMSRKNARFAGCVVPLGAAAVLAAAGLHDRGWAFIATIALLGLSGITHLEWRSFRYFRHRLAGLNFEIARLEADLETHLEGG